MKASKIRGAKYNINGGIDVEIYINETDGWSPYTVPINENSPLSLSVLGLLDGVVISDYEPLPLPTPEEIRANMPPLTPREFRDILIDEGILTDAVPDEVTLAIQQIPFDKERAKALNAWQNPTMFTRTDPYIDMIGAMFGLSPEDIDLLWVTDNEFK